jgi:hypothetical protein
MKSDGMGGEETEIRILDDHWSVGETRVGSTVLYPYRSPSIDHLLYTLSERKVSIRLAATPGAPVFY